MVKGNRILGLEINTYDRVVCDLDPDEQGGHLGHQLSLDVMRERGVLHGPG